MNRWIDASEEDRQQTSYIVASEKNISQGAVEKDWWVTAILKVLFTLSPAKYMFFKGGTSLSKGWNLIDRFSEDIDIALFRNYYLEVKGKECANAATNNLMIWRDLWILHMRRPRLQICHCMKK